MGEIDNSAVNEFRECPFLYFEGRVQGLELKPRIGEVIPKDLGSRVHELLQEYYQDMRGKPIPSFPESENVVLETEAQIIFAAYKAKYPQEDFDVVDVERTFRVELPELCPGCYSKNVIPYPDDIDLFCGECGERFDRRNHIYTGKIDLTYRDRETGGLCIMDHKTEKRRSNSNRPQRWAARDQASLYLWAAERIYKENVEKFVLNLLKRPSDKLQEPPLFPDRQRLERTFDQIEIAVRDLVFVADEIDRYKKIFGDGLWPSHRENCDNGYYQCDFYMPHTYGWSTEIKREKYQPKKPYLNLAGIPIIQS